MTKKVLFAVTAALVALIALPTAASAQYGPIPPIPPFPGPPGPPGPGPTPPQPGQPVQVGQIGGANREDTAVLLSQDNFPIAGSAGCVVLATGLNFPDALAGTPLAVSCNGPILLAGVELTSGARTAGIGPTTLAEIQRVLASGGLVYILGGPAAVSPTVDEQLLGLGFEVLRVEGPTRFETAVAIAGVLGNPAVILLATGLDFPDALSSGAAAARLSGAVLLTAGTEIPPATGQYLANQGLTLYAVGGPAAQAAPQAEGLVGADRYQTASTVANRFFNAPAGAGVATGEDFPDALTGGAHIALRAGGPIVLTRTAELPDPSAQYLEAKRVPLRVVFIYGGSAAVSPEAVAQIEAALRRGDV